jgi:ABC-type multidrug transport system ATPase subunit/ABC-type multidrug transport system permease subunit
MGPSGSGKTTLLNTLAQRQTASVQGQINVNGVEQPLSVHRDISAFVEQEDTLIGSLTVHETLAFSAKLALPRTVTSSDVQARIQQLARSFGLQNQSQTLIGTPLQKGLSGGQKRRVSVATQLITSPKILYLDEPTSGLDSTASYEVISFLREFARRNKVLMIASIHQPSTKTFELFDQVYVLSQGKTCYYGSTTELPPFFASLGLAVPPMTNPAEHILDITNVDFSADAGDGQSRLDRITSSWKLSGQAVRLGAAIHEDPGVLGQNRNPALSTAARAKPSTARQVLTLLHRSFVKSYRDLTAYWIRVAMYMGLAIMMGTVWLRLSADQDHIQPFINAIVSVNSIPSSIVPKKTKLTPPLQQFFGSAFMSFMAVAYVPAFLEDRAMFVKERANGLYGPTAFLLSNFLTGLPFLFLISVLFSTVAYWLMNMNPTGAAFMTWIMWLFLDLLAAESLVVLLASLFPNFVVALALIAFANGLWMSVGGFLVSMPVLNVFWKYVFHYIDYQAYVFQGMMVNEFAERSYDCGRTADRSCQCLYPSALQNECKISGSAVLDNYGYSAGKEGEWVGILLGIIAVYRLLAWFVTWYKRS